MAVLLQSRVGQYRGSFFSVFLQPFLFPVFACISNIKTFIELIFSILGVTEYLSKPFTAEDLSKRIAHVINRPRDYIDNLPHFFGPDRRRIGKDYSGPLRRKTDRK
jgi:hypothetical protein